MLSFCVFGAALHQLSRKISNITLRTVAVYICAAVIAATVVGRLLSGVHWFTDIIAGILISVSLLFFYSGFCNLFKKN